MRIALNWFEVTLPTTEFTVGTQDVVVSSGQPPKAPTLPHRVVRRKTDQTFRFLHLTNDPPTEAPLQPLQALDDPSFVKIAVEEGFAGLLKSKGFLVCRQHVGSTAYIQTSESMFPKVYTFFRGVSFRSFYGFGPRANRWGLILNYATSQRFCLTLEDQKLRQLALGKRVVPVSSNPTTGEDDGRRSGILVSVQGQEALIERPRSEPIQAPLGDWTLPCRRELLDDYLHQANGSTASADVTRSLQVASFSLTRAGRMNTALAKDQLNAVQHLLHDHGLTRFCLPLPNDPPVSVSEHPLVMGE